MDIFNVFEISATALSAQRLRINLVSSNLANIDSTRSTNGGPYQRQDVIFAAVPTQKQFENFLHENLEGVQVVEIIKDPRPFKQKYDPSHPDADKGGYVTMPNINLMEEMVNLILACRSYEANVTVINATKNMALKALEL
ncbi:MAG: flagellar basal body rod protein FlgC [Thermodesulfobacteriota bacterium]|nr:flagellar basal body rod protein FlgC [Thermodesulfobacteriota bacterium]